MKEKKVGDIIVFDYDVYDIENNVEKVYDHTDTLTGVVEEVIPDPRYTKYRVKLTGVINGGSEYNGLIGNNKFIASDDKVYRGSALFGILHPNLQRPTVEQVRYIQSCYDHKSGRNFSPEYIIRNWYKNIMGDLYDGER